MHGLCIGQPQVLEEELLEKMEQRLLEKEGSGCRVLLVSLFGVCPTTALSALSADLPLHHGSTGE